MTSRRSLLLNMYEAMLDRLGPSHWWPGESPFEVMVGAILTQNASWENVARAIAALKAENLLAPERLYLLSHSELAERIRPAGYFRLKAQRLKNFLLFLKQEYRFNLESLQSEDLAPLRIRLLGVNGIGPETADSILLYALNKPSFVVDAYTRRIASRHGLVTEEVDYASLQRYYTEALPSDVVIYNEYHALLVRTAKQWCRKKNPLCEACPLGSFPR